MYNEGGTQDLSLARSAPGFHNLPNRNEAVAFQLHKLCKL